jgi:hypothetical protein
MRTLAPGAWPRLLSLVGLFAPACIDPAPRFVVTVGPMGLAAATLKAEVMDVERQVPVGDVLLLPAPPGGFGEEARLVLILPDAESGLVRVDVSVQDGSDCTVSAASSVRSIEAQERIDLWMTLTPTTRICPASLHQY